MPAPLGMTDPKRNLPSARGQDMRAYNPSWNDQIAGWLYDHTSRSPAAQNFVRGLMGSTGLGKQQMGVVDFTPVAGPTLEAQEAYNNDDMIGMGLAGVGAGMVPGPGRARTILGRTVQDAGSQLAMQPIKNQHDQDRRVDLQRQNGLIY